MLNIQEDTKEQFEGRKLYKGDLVTVDQLVTLGFPSALPVQPVKTQLEYGQLPPSFVMTKLVANGWGSYTMHYIVPKTGIRTYRDVPKDLQLNILTGVRGEELRKEWQDVVVTKLASLGRRMVATLGTDPEIFAVNESGEVVPAWTYLPGKDKPAAFNLNNCSGTAYWDGFQAEFTTRGTDTCLSWVNDNVQAGLRTIHEAAKKVGAKLTIDSVLPVNPDFLQTEAEEHVQFGCAPSFNAYGLRGNIEDGRNVPFRFAGGHLHFGITYNKTRERIVQYVKHLDKVLGVATVAMLGELDNPIRRQFYGLPGEYRMPAHGFEYRTLSNAWLCHPLALNMVFDLGRSVCGLGEEGFLDAWKSSEEETLEIIIKNDITKAREVLDRNKDMFRQICKVIGGHYGSDVKMDLAFNIWRNGISTAVENPRDLVGNWNLEKHWTLHGDGMGKCWDKAYVQLINGQKL